MNLIKKDMIPQLQKKLLTKLQDSVMTSQMALQRKISKAAEELSSFKKECKEGGFVAGNSLNINEDGGIVEEASQKDENSVETNKGFGCDMDEDFIKMLIRNELEDNE